MVFQEGCPNIVNLTKAFASRGIRASLFQIIEDGKIKSTQYWPLEPGAFQSYGKMFVNTKKVRAAVHSGSVPPRHIYS
ncbi:hypothetical protein ANCDUO_13981 [Ancylostoma duodenale]|uniref:Tyrosine-protein phosphatase domain-containing protein n=1 Tax=Ancylostoma duodenale TaxID=51022 RepID=A0A0C2G4F5_9BILA|nr:hypothetical protein ANCDUO_13981 [Ancylostoma duodenale]